MMININLIAERRARKVKEVTILRLSTIGLALVILAMGLLNTLARIEYYAESKRVAMLNQDLESATAKKAELDRIKARIVARQPIVTLLKQVQLSEAAWMIILTDFTRVMPDDVAIAGINASPGKDGMEIRVSGVASDETTVGEFMVALREKTRWAKTPVPGPITAENEDTGAGVRFSLIIPVRGMIGGELK